MSTTSRARRDYPTCYRLEEERLVPVADVRRPTDPRAELVHDQLRSRVSSQRFSCLGAKAAFSAGQYWIGLYDEMATPLSTQSLARDLQAFSAEENQRKTDDLTFRTFIGTFMGPVCPDESSF